MDKQQVEDQVHAKSVAEHLHDLEEQHKSDAAALPDGPEKETLEVVAERLSDEAWHVEEQNELDPRPSGLWPTPE